MYCYTCVNIGVLVTIKGVLLLREGKEKEGERGREEEGKGNGKGGRARERKMEGKWGEGEGLWTSASLNFSEALLIGE